MIKQNNLGSHSSINNQYCQQDEPNQYHESVISINVHSSFSFSQCLHYMNNKHNDIAYTIEGNTIRKAIYVDAMKMLIQVECDTCYLKITVLSGEITEVTKQKIKTYVVDWLDLDTDVQPFYERLLKTPQLTHMVERLRSLHLIGYPDLYEVLCWCVIGQVISLGFAHNIKRRMVEKYGDTISYQGKVYHLFPKAEVLTTINKDALMALQLTSTKAACLIELAKRFNSNAINQTQLLNLPTLRQKQNVLLDVKGIGIWTVNYALLKCFHEKNCIPYGDAVLIKKLMSYHIIHNKNDTSNLDRFYAQFTDWQHYLTFYLWNDG